VPIRVAPYRFLQSISIRLRIHCNRHCWTHWRSETIYFSVEVPEPFPTTSVIAPIASVVAVGAGLAVYFKKRNHLSEKNGKPRTSQGNRSLNLCLLRSLFCFAFSRLLWFFNNLRVNLNNIVRYHVSPHRFPSPFPTVMRIKPHSPA
jgi:hypothetical protein